MGKAKDSFIVYYDWEEALSDLSNEQLGGFLRAVFDYEKRGVTYDGQDSAVKMAMRFVYGTLDRNREKYKATCERNRRNIEKRWGNPKDTSGNSGTENRTTDTSGNSGTENRTTDTSGISGIPHDTKYTEHEPEHEREHEPDPERDREHEHDASGGGSGLSFARELELVMEKLTDAGIPVDEGAEQKLVEWLQNHGSSFVDEAVGEAVQRKARKFGYLEGIVRNWVREGITSGEKAEAYQQRKKTPKAPAPCPAPQPVRDQEREAAESADRAAEIQRMLMEWQSACTDGSGDGL